MGMGGGMMGFTIDGGSSARPDRPDRAAGAVEEWTITNPGPMDHPFHLHVWPMQVIEDGGRPLDGRTWQDVVNVPARGGSRSGWLSRTSPGRTVYHCHILDHEDLGMMGVVEVR